MEDFGNGQGLSTPGPGFDGWVQRGRGGGDGGEEDSGPESGADGVVEGEVEGFHVHYRLCSAIMLWAVVVRIFIFICR